MKSATITWITYNNCGTYLQAYALQHIIKSMGIDNRIIDDSPVVYNSWIKAKIIRILRNIRETKNSTYYIYKKFAKSYLNIDRNYIIPKDLEKKYDIFICGSDQIWSVYLPFKSFYYLDFTNKKKIAYAPSTSTGLSTEEYIKNVKYLIERFDAISVREEDDAKMLSEFINKNIITVLDPTLLLTPNDWTRIEIPVYDSGYVICYFLTPNERYLNYAINYAKKNNKLLYIFSTDKTYANFGDKRIPSGPREFVSYIHHADKVLTDSYHASIFSILFKKDFTTFARFKESSDSNQNSRIENLFTKLNISFHFIREEELTKADEISIPDYDLVYQILDDEKAKSIEFLKNAIFD